MNLSTHAIAHWLRSTLAHGQTAAEPDSVDFDSIGHEAAEPWLQTALWQQMSVEIEQTMERR